MEADGGLTGTLLTGTELTFTALRTAGGDRVAGGYTHDSRLRS